MYHPVILCSRCRIGGLSGLSDHEPGICGRQGWRRPLQEPENGVGIGIQGRTTRAVETCMSVLRCCGGFRCLVRVLFVPVSLHLSFVPKWKSLAVNTMVAPPFPNKKERHRSRKAISLCLQTRRNHTRFLTKLKEVRMSVLRI